MALALIAYLFTVIASFLAALGDPATALQISSGSLWIWLVPVILGWVVVGTQYSHSSIDNALRVNAEPAARALEPSVIANGPNPRMSEPRPQKGLVVRSGLSPQPHRAQTAAGEFGTPDFDRLRLPSWCGRRVEGDERLKGPIYNYAKLFTWWQLAITVHDALNHTLDNVSNDVACDGIYLHTQQQLQAQNQTPSQPANAPVPRWDDARGEDNLVADARDTSAYCGLQTQQPICAYPAWSAHPDTPRLRSMSHSVHERIVIASVVAMFVQWGTAGPSIIMAYRTPTIGMGCRTASYTLYGVLATVAWICLLASMLVSHQVMLLYQRKHIKNASLDFRRPPSDPNTPNQYDRTWWHSTLCGIAVFLRCFGKTIVVLNTLWLIVSSLFEFTGGFDNCWCKGDYIGLGSKGWIVLSKHSKDLAMAATLPWGGGLAMTLIVCAASSIFFAVGSYRSGT